MKRITNIGMLRSGLAEIASNHGFKSDVYASEGCAVIYGGTNIPTIADVRMLCDDLDIPSDCVESNSCGIDIYLDETFMSRARKTYVKKEGGELWRKNPLL